MELIIDRASLSLTNDIHAPLWTLLTIAFLVAALVAAVRK